MDAPILKVSNLTKHFSVRKGLFRRNAEMLRAVDGVSFELQRGQTMGIVGESGCGKSTLAKTLMLLEEPTSGEMQFGGRQITPADADSLRRRMQIVFQDPYNSLPPRMTVQNVIADPLRIHRLCDDSEVESRVENVMKEVGLDPQRANQYPFQFSGGQRQRIGIARAIIMEPEAIILDESVSALDVSVQAQVLNLLKDLQEKHRLSYLFISHDLRVVQYMSDTISVMYLGKIVEQGPSEAIYSRPLHPYTRALLEAVPGIGADGRTRLRLQGEPPSPTNPPPGCYFHPRCPMARDRCESETPILQEWQPGRWSACHFADELISGKNLSENREAGSSSASSR